MLRRDQPGRSHDRGGPPHVPRPRRTRCSTLPARSRRPSRTAQPRSRRPGGCRADLLDALAAAGCLRMLLPHSHGGVGADLPAALRLFETLAEADASVAWTVMIGGSAWIDLAGLPRATFDALFARRTRRRRGRRVRAERLDQPRRRRLPGDGPVGLRQWLRARRPGSTATAVEGDRRRRPPAADGGVRTRPGRDRGHLDGAGPARNGQPPHPRRRRSCSRRTDVASAGRRAVPGRAGGPHPGACAARAVRRRASRSASRRGPWTTLSRSAGSKVPLLARRTGLPPTRVVPGRPGHGRHRPAGSPSAAVRVGRGGVGDRRGRRAVHARGNGRRPARPRSGRRSGR